MIELKNITKSYKDGEKMNNVLKSINLVINDNDFITIKGHSGGGKSTLLNIISLLSKPTTGSIYFDGKEVDINNEKEVESVRRKKIGLVFQSANLISCLNSLDNILLPAYGENREKLKEKAIKLMDRVGLKGKYKSRVRALSGGEAQRVSIVRALINDPEIILCDEPTGALDQETGRKVIDLLKEIYIEEKCTLIIVTHDEKIAALGERKFVMKGGRLIEME